MNQQSVLSQTFATIKHHPKPILIFVVVSGIVQFLQTQLIEVCSDLVEKLNQIEPVLAVVWCFVLNVLPYLLFALVMTYLYLFTLNSIFSKESPKNALFFDEVLGYDRKKVSTLFLLYLFTQLAIGIDEFVQDFLVLRDYVSEWDYIQEISSILINLLFFPAVAAITFYLFPRKIAEYIASRSRKSAQLIVMRGMLPVYFTYLYVAVFFGIFSFILGSTYQTLLFPIYWLAYLFLILAFYRLYLPLNMAS